MNELQKKVYDYVRQNPNTTIHQISTALKIEDVETLNAVLKLQSKHYIKQDIQPLGHGIIECCYYSVEN